MLKVQALSKSYDSDNGSVKVIEQLDFEVARGEFVCIVGPSGAGKSTLLRCLSGLHPASGGSVVLDGKVVDAPPPQMAVVFQDYSRSLLPWLTVAANVELPLKQRIKSKPDRQAAVRRSLQAVGLVAATGMYPWQLSGGMQQRVAIARALACEPQVLVMDEPFASVDAQTRAELEDLVHELRRDLGITVLVVTHDIDESVYLGDRVIVLTHRPCRIRELIEVDLPHPRDQIITKQLPEFARLRARIADEIRKAVAGHAH
ncbi:MAG: ABC transporter ATP-binding protein [Burkholderiales bacterium]|nr:ABC transporter ATP-binding protein [Burkholderiales bacterium]